MLVIFVARDRPFKVYITTPDEYSRVLNAEGIDPDLAAFQNITLERLILVSDRVSDYVVLNLKR